MRYLGDLAPLVSTPDAPVCSTFSSREPSGNVHRHILYTEDVHSRDCLQRGFDTDWTSVKIGPRIVGHANISDNQRGGGIKAVFIRKTRQWTSTVEHTRL